MLWVNQRLILKELQKIMSGVTDLQTAVQTIAAGVTQAVTDINTAVTLIQQLKSTGGLSDADAETLAQTLTSAATSLSTADSALKGQES
jgi:hypothetical protein